MSSPRLYIAGMGMITPLGPNVATTVAAVNAGISASTLSEYDTDDGEPITMARVPDEVFEHIKYEFEEGNNVFNHRDGRMIRMAIAALRESVAAVNTLDATPLIMAVPADQIQDKGYTPFIPALARNLKPWIELPLTRRISTGRAASIEAIHFAFQYLMNQPQDYILILGVDSYDDDTVINQYKNRLLSRSSADSFAPGEGACALLLTRHIERAEQKNGSVIALNPPSMAEEDGHLFSDKPYRGDGLDRAFKGALTSHPTNSIQSIYSSMNGENHWAKEYGVAYLRNKEKFIEKIKIDHPADCYGDLGVATSAALIIAAAKNLQRTNTTKSLVYSSSDHGLRGALVIEKVPFREANKVGEKNDSIG
jgi:3-oxoacyl-[acyl-carrier-protein] synthase-1